MSGKSSSTLGPVISGRGTGVGEFRPDAGRDDGEFGRLVRAQRVAGARVKPADDSDEEDRSLRVAPASRHSPAVARNAPEAYRVRIFVPKHLRGAKGEPFAGILEFLNKLKKDEPANSKDLQAEFKKNNYTPISPTEPSPGKKEYSSDALTVTVEQGADGNYKIKSNGPAIVAITLKGKDGKDTDQQIVISYGEDGKVNKIVPSDIKQVAHGKATTKAGLSLPFTPEEYTKMFSEAEAVQARSSGRVAALSAHTVSKLRGRDFTRRADREPAKTMRRHEARARATGSSASDRPGGAYARRSGSASLPARS